ncbi:sulfurtransferase complex subunit TusD [Aestuariibacter sp. AA17]|uniref:Sulfurtransferase complex subunit TusD n=1 Tax=Fluctibacter corallii TaxID=2984329 RepID=A0ABT3A651_9ALTE|nr:sulfurtransferase complex subunit TusD [Aestuariibacter sp. AA17]MCV2884083.1 sulfurtransferase complex subunit TusD [Aestuariibacter sp. AA17]
MASFAIVVTRAPFDSQGAYTALRFSQAALAAGHDIKGVFFYQAGSANANGFIAGHSDELNMHHAWKAFKASTQTPLMVCVTAANRRGIVSEQDAEDLDLQHFNFDAPFESVGLGELVSIINDADRTIQF